MYFIILQPDLNSIKRLNNRLKLNQTKRKKQDIILSILNILSNKL